MVKNINPNTVLSNEDVIEILNSSFNEKFFVWAKLKELIQSGHRDLIFTAVMPLLNPITQFYEKHLPDYGTYREDFRSDVLRMLLEKMETYHPYMDGNQYTGNVFFKPHIRNIYKKTCEKIKKHTNFSSLDSLSEEELYYRLREDEMGYGTLMEDEVIERIEVADIKTTYDSMKEKYKKSPSYAKKKTIEFIKKRYQF